ncbi:MAG TPA: hypothetical protein VFH37_00350 [Candidatus Saccharimonadales bacterium]|nr:hypothetical protein [Candidatus Saccharimonadales bacterium]
MARQHQKHIVRSLLAASIVLSAVGLGILSGHASGAQLIPRELTLTNSSVSARNTYHLSFQIATTGTLGSIDILFCSNSPLIADGCVAPSGMDAGIAFLLGQSGETGFSISPASTANEIILTRAPSADGTQLNTYDLANIINPSTTGSYYARIQTYASNDATGPSTDYGGVAFSITSSISITSQVPPYVLFCSAVIVPAYNCSSANGSVVDLGNIKSNSTSAGQSQLLVATNAGSGYSIYMQGTSLTSGNDVINSLSLPTAPVSGTNQFGLNLRANLLPAVGQDPAGPGTGVPTFDYNQPDKYKFVSGDIIASSPLAEDFRRFTVSYVADATSSQPAGVYVSTVTYIVVGNF